MNITHIEDIRDHAVVVAVAHDRSRLWLLNDEHPSSPYVIDRIEPPHIHVRSAQAQHGHASEIGEDAFFEEIATAINPASSIVLLGHGTGKANAAERFARYLRDHRKSISIKVLALEVVNLPALTDGEVLREARRKWKAMTLRA
jgi:hypothetical protein